MIELLTSPEAWAALLTLTALEIVLGIDNVIFLSVIVSRIPEPQATRARQIGLILALVFRIVLLSLLVWLIGLTEPVITVKSVALSWRDIILIAGGMFLIAKATHEIHAEVESGEGEQDEKSAANAFFWVIMQIIVIDMVFSLDSIITAIGMAQDLEIMIAAVMIACLIMYISSGPVARFVAEHPTTKMLALAFLVLIGVGVVPLLFTGKDSVDALNLVGSEEFAFEGIREGVAASKPIGVDVRRPGGEELRFNVVADVRSAAEAELLVRGGMFQAALEASLK